MPTYTVTIDGRIYDVTSDKDLTDVQAYQYAKQQAGQTPADAPLTEREQASAGMRGLGDALKATAPVAATAGAAMFGGPLAAGVGRLATAALGSPIGGAIAGGALGYKRGGYLTPPGIPGAIEGAITGATFGPPASKMIRGLRLLGKAAPAAEAAAPAAAGVLRTAAPTVAREAAATGGSQSAEELAAELARQLGTPNESELANFIARIRR